MRPTSAPRRRERLGGLGRQGQLAQEGAIGQPWIVASMDQQAGCSFRPAAVATVEPGEPRSL